MSDKAKKTQDEEESPSDVAKRQKRLDFLMKQTEMFSQFLTTTGTKPKKNRSALNESQLSPSKALTDSNE